MADNSAGSGHQFERDLREIRQARGVSLSEVQQETRIPADVLDRFESGHLAGDPNYNEVYLRNLLKAYGTAVGLPPADVLNSYTASKAGTYKGELRRHVGADESEAVPPTPPPPETPADTGAKQPASEGKKADAPPDSKPEKKEPSRSEPPRPSSSAAPPAVTALKEAQQPTPVEPKTPRTEPKARVQSRESVTSSTSGIEGSWGIIIGGTLVALLVIGGAMWLMLRSDSPEVDPVSQVVTTPEDEEEAEDPDEAAPATDAPRLEMPIEVTVIAEDGALGGGSGFRVTEVPDVRRPYWIEQGEGQTFSSDSLVIIWGTGEGDNLGIPAEARLRLQGFTWNPQTGAVLRIDQTRGQAILDSLHRTQAGQSP